MPGGTGIEYPAKRGVAKLSEGCTVREFIEELEDFAKEFGDDTELVVVRDDGREGTPIISGGPGEVGGSPKICLL
jgi:hypothetical protein